MDPNYQMPIPTLGELPYLLAPEEYSPAYLDLKVACFGYRNYFYTATHVALYTATHVALYTATHVAHCTIRKMGYPWSGNTLLHNNVISAYALGGQPWAERLFAHKRAQVDTEAQTIQRLCGFGPRADRDKRRHPQKSC